MFLCCAGVRGVPEENRTKKHCNALFLIAEKDYEAVSRQMGNFIVEYYGIKGASAFPLDPGKIGGYGNMGKYKAIIESLIGDSFNSMDFIDCGYSISDIEIKELIMRIGEYIESVIKPRYDMALRAMGLKSSKKLIPVALKDIKDKFALYNGEYNTSTLISDDKFMKAIMELFDMYEIK